MVGTVIDAVIGVLFGGVAILVGYGLYAFRRAPEAGAALTSGRQVSLRREVVWTALSALLLLGIVLWYAH